MVESRIIRPQTTIQPDKHVLLRERISEVAEGYANAFFLYGPAGHGKTHAVRDTLEAMSTPYVPHTTHLTAASLYDVLHAHPDKIHYFDDMESLLHDRKASSIWRAATGGNKRKRIIEYKTRNEDSSFVFTGGIIIMCNEMLSHDPKWRAVASRFAEMEWRLSDDEMSVTMRTIAAQGYKSEKCNLSPKEAMTVAEYVIDLIKQPEYKAELRTLCEHSFPSFQRWKDGKSALQWQDLVSSKLQTRVDAPSRNEANQQKNDIAISCHVRGANTEERLALWNAETGLSKNAYYSARKRCQELGTWPLKKLPTHDLDLGAALDGALDSIFDN